ncbi:MAG: IS110 family transposase [Hyphomicrobiales bacterium]|nr:IS110 family transposase [Hyphomicrobiales bacterium]MBV9517736.1 IS110 family transposase [Hyphomicrobiales bacterium]
MFVGLELSLSKWLIGVGSSRRATIRRHYVRGGDLPSLLDLLRRIATEEEKRSGLSGKIHICFEAGRDGHWLYRALKTAGYDVYEIDPASIAVNRRARRAKSDGLDVAMLVRNLARFVRGELDVFRVVVVPSEEEEDAKRPGREYERLVKERTSHIARIKSLLFLQGIRDFNPRAADWLERLVALPLRPGLRAELVRECRRLSGIIADIAELEAEMKAAITMTKKVKPAVSAIQLPSHVQFTIKQLAKLKSIGLHFSTLLGCELFYRKFSNRRAVAQYLGLTPSPFQSGDTARDQGISKAGNKRARKAMIELAWVWLQHQPESALSQWFLQRVGDLKGRIRRIAIVALARKLAVALWRYLESGIIPERAVLKQA